MRNNVSKRVRRQTGGTFGQTRFVRRCHRSPAFIGCDNGFLTVSANIAKGRQVLKRKKGANADKSWGAQVLQSMSATDAPFSPRHLAL